MNQMTVNKQPTFHNPHTLQTWAVMPPRFDPNYALENLERLANTLEPISLKEMDSVALMNRTDTKFVLTIQQLIHALAAVQDEYRILCVEGHRLNAYRTLYFDTPDFEFYNLHVNNRAERYKVRSREYVHTADSFLEVKHKNRKGRTIKSRIATEHPIEQMNNKMVGWLDQVLPYDGRELEPKLWNSFSRITLVSKQCCERVTLDVDLAFHTHTQKQRLRDVAVAEIKMDSSANGSAFLAQMHAQRIHPQGFSKYCIGVAMLYKQVKKNTLKPKMQRINKMNGEFLTL